MTDAYDLTIEEGSPKQIALEMLRAYVTYRGGKLNNLLDTGCGDGTLAFLIKKEGLAQNVYGVDIDENLLQIAKRRGILVYRVNLEIEKLPFQNEYFDAVLLIDVIEHIINIDNILREIYRVLKKTGVLVLSTPNIQFIYHIVRLFMGYGPRTSFHRSKSVSYYRSELYDGGHVHYFTVKDIYDLLNTYGFICVKTKGTYNVSKKIVRKIMKLASKSSLLLQFLCPGFVVQCIKG